MIDCSLNITFFHNCVTKILNFFFLDTSVAHSPHFDWVVAHVGSSFPKTVITRVLSCGLKDFCAKGNIQSSSKSAKLNSVVGILGHLASSHFTDIRKALLELFEVCSNYLQKK